MYTLNVLIICALIALGAGFTAGYLVGLFRWKNSPAKAEAESTAIREGREQAEARFQSQINELKQKLDEQNTIQTQEAQGEASKKS